MKKRRRAQNLIRLEDVGGFFDELHRESDRAAAVLGAAYLDECLRELITSFLIDNEKEVDQLLKRSLLTFGSRIRASYCMGLISEDEHHDLQTIRDIRIGFAHDLHGLSFSTPWIIDLCNALQHPKDIPQWPGTPTARNLFMLTTDLLSLQLRLRTLQQKGQHRLVPSGFKVVETVR